MALQNLQKERLKKLNNIRRLGIDPYPARSERKQIISQAIKMMGKKVTVAGRIRSIRPHGKITFMDLEDASGRMQLLFRQDNLKGEQYEFLPNLDIGDFLQVSGEIIKTQAGEITVSVDDFKLLTKSVRPLPSNWYGLKDTEERLRKRYLDLIINPETKELFLLKTKFWASVRNYLIKQGGMEVETPVLQPIPGGGDARPFITHHFAQNIKLYLRISPELYLKRLLVGGFEKVFEIGRIFRNEGIDDEHLQDYTQMEMYWAYYDYEKLMELIGRLFKHIVREILGASSHQCQNKTIDWGSTWKRYDYYEEFEKYTGLKLEKVKEKDLINYTKDNGIDADKHIGKGRLVDVIFKKRVRPHLIEPGFLVLPPIDIEPLAKRYPKDPNRVERFQVVAGGTELGKGFSELNDPIDQRKRFEEQVKLGEAGDKEAQRMDEDFVETLEYGMPPTAGFGMSERFFAFLMDKPVREIVFFPLMKPK